MVSRAPTEGRVLGLDAVDWMLLLAGAALAGFVALLL
jgi:hypothetical protein